jgi:hypothetical protein
MPMERMIMGIIIKRKIFFRLESLDKYRTARIIITNSLIKILFGAFNDAHLHVSEAGPVTTASSQNMS